MSFRWAAFAAASLLAGPVRAETSRNPDRWPSLQLSELGSQSSGSRQDATAKGVTDSRELQSSIVSFGATLLVPVSDAWSVTANAGTNLTHGESAALTDPKAGIALSSSTTDNSEVTYQLTLRRYFLDRRLTAASTEKNPDRWPSLGVTFNGANTVGYGAGFSQGVVAQTLNSYGYGLTADFRAPIDDFWTLIPSLGAAYSSSSIPPSLTAGGSYSISRTLTFGGQARYYFVGHNLITKDAGTNPDEWNMLYFDLGGTRSISATSDAITAAGVYTNHASKSSSVTGTLGTRLPVTNHATLTFFVEGQYAQSSVDGATPTANRTPSVEFSGQLKYYFFSKD
jgi:hypothetical protein